MGARLSLLEEEDVVDKEIEEELAFYKVVKMKFASLFFSLISENMLSDFDIYNDRETVSWRTYLNIFCAVRDKRDTELEVYQRSLCHIATTGYIMEQSDAAPVYFDDEDEEEGASSSSKNKQNGKGKGHADDYTDDDESDVSDEDNSNESDDEDSEEEEEGQSRRSPMTPKMKRRKDWNPHVLSPVFFGYTMKSLKTHEEEEISQRANLKEAEQRAVNRVKASRMTLLDTFQSASKNQENNRVKKITHLEEQYLAARTKREANLKKMQIDLPPNSFRDYKVSSAISLVVISSNTNDNSSKI